MTSAALALASAALVGNAGSLPHAAPVVSLSASPARLALTGDAGAPITLRNFGRSTVLVRVGPGDVVLGLRGRPALARRRAGSAASWLHVRPQRVSLAPGAASIVNVRSAVPRGAAPGDHHAVVLFTTRAERSARVGVRMRLGVRVVVRVPGTIVRRLAVRNLRVRRHGRVRLLDVGLSNLGNVTEALGPGRVVVSLLVRGRIVARVRTGRRELLPRSYGVATGAYTGPIRGRALARVEARGARRRAFWIRL